MSCSVLDKIHHYCIASVTKGLTEEMFKSGLRKHLESSGWYGGKYDHLPDTEENQKKKESYLNWRLGVIFRTNLSTAYAAGKYRQMMRVADMRPIWVYSALLDKRTRPAHAALHNKAFRFNDPFWSTYYPPNGWNCRCFIYSITESQAASRGIEILSSDENGNPPLIAYANEQGNANQILWGNFCPSEWRYNPGQEAYKPDWSKYTNLAKIEAGKTTALEVIRKTWEIDKLNAERWQSDDIALVEKNMTEIRKLSEELYHDLYAGVADNGNIYEYKKQKKNTDSKNYKGRTGNNSDFLIKFKYAGVKTESLTSEGEPNTYVDYYVGGRIKRRRFYGEDGKAVLDVHTDGNKNIKEHPYSYNGLHAHCEPCSRDIGNGGDLSVAEYYFNKDIYDDQR